MEPFQRPCFSSQMDYISGSFYDGFVLYARALQENLAEGGAQNNGINITMRMQNRRFWGKWLFSSSSTSSTSLSSSFFFCFFPFLFFFSSFPKMPRN